MEYILISGAKIKVMLGREDMERYELQSTEMDYENVQTRRAFRKILEDVKRNTGFDIGAEQVLVQVYPCRDGGCEMFVTKLSKTKEENETKPSHPREITMLSIRLCYYIFGCFEELLSAILEIRRRGYKRRSSLYRGQAGEWYLCLEECVSSGARRQAGELSFLEEYAQKRRGYTMLAYVKEHSTPVIEDNAVETLSAAFA